MGYNAYLLLLKNTCSNSTWHQHKFTGDMNF